MRTLAAQRALRTRFSPENLLSRYIAGAAAQPSAVQQRAYFTFIDALVLNDIWGRLDILYLLGASAADLALTNMVNSLYPLTAVNAPTFLADRGYTFNGTTQELTTTYAPSLDGNHLKKNSICNGCFALTAGSSTGFDFGETTGTLMGIRSRSGANSASRSGTASAVSATSGGVVPTHICGVRRSHDGGSHFLFKNGVNNVSGANASSALSASTYGIGRAISLYSDRQIFMCHAGGTLSDMQVLAFYNAALALGQALGAM